MLRYHKQFLLYSTLIYFLSFPLEASRYKDMESRIAALVEKHFSDGLADVEIELKTFTNSTFFFRTDVENAWRSRRSRRYFIYINEKLMEAPPSSAALDAILVHELQHLADYSQMNVFELLIMFFKYVVWRNETYIVSYERATDQSAIDKGYGAGLIEYRLWVNNQMSPESLELQKRRYFQPEEIERLIKRQTP